MSEYDGRKPEPPYPIVGDEDAAFVRAAWEDDVKAMGIDLDYLTARNAALEAAHVQMQASLDHAYAEIEHWKAVAISDGQTIDYHVAEIGRLTGEKSYLSDEVIPALKAEAKSLQASLDAAYADRATYNAWAEEVRVTVAWMRDEDKKMRAALQEVLDDPLSDIRADMRFGIAQLINQMSSVRGCTKCGVLASICMCETQ